MTLLQVRKIAAKYNGKITSNYLPHDHSTEYCAIAPDGYVWVDSNSIHMSVFRYASFGESISDVLTELIERMEYGIAKEDEE